MFTGLIEELGTIKAIAKRNEALQLTVKAKTVLENINIGDSLAVNGVCLTVTGFNRSSFSVEIVPETIDRTTVSRLGVGDRVNLERAVQAGERLGGHLVSGHIDGIGKIEERKKEKNRILFKIKFPEELSKYIIPQGSIAVDGISLTVVGISKDVFTVAVIPHTAQVTTLGFKTVGSQVNLEVDFLGKYVERFVSVNDKEKKGITVDSLKKWGY